MQVRVFDEAVVHKKILFPARFSGEFRSANIPPDIDDRGVFLNVEEPLVVIGAMQGRNALLQAGRLKVKFLDAAFIEKKRDIGMSQCYAEKFILYVAHFNRITFEKFTAGRRIEE